MSPARRALPVDPQEESSAVQPRGLLPLEIEVGTLQAALLDADPHAGDGVAVADGLSELCRAEALRARRQVDGFEQARLAVAVVAVDDVQARNELGLEALQIAEVPNSDLDDGQRAQGAPPRTAGEGASEVARAFGSRSQIRMGMTTAT